ncbi:3'(2'),5'-bisphosphate nucleotidase CysQ [Nocardia cyriacigeorgica]|uniref:3'(2'),5'-bisphosphate nucleotidase CysQ n=1 Tax=Nocardia cyriacigeorgica TaxID=135487 RepID=A0A6P1D8Z8_9NOCA|nr:3'(2'),5'-bisphosphate nucleotidase CysQ [Nocardia cyriacigeorgica]NEW45704.1 3'(2'),5'-bisphosphate nucleotidase CysQ [Nocardia cyriacigeorgica]
MISDSELAADLAESAGQLLLDLRALGLEEAGAAKELGRRGDAEANSLLLERLTAARPGDAVLSEESADSADRLDAERVWIIDPLDGTREFALGGRSDWAVHVALWQAGHGITAAAVAQPALGAVYMTGRTTAAPSVARSRPRILVSESRPPEFTDALVRTWPAEVIGMGSAGAKAMAVLRGEADAYVHAGGQWEWDSAAPVGVAHSAGLHACRVDGSPLTYNAPHPYLPDLLICRPELAEPLLARIAAVSDTSSGAS